MRLVAPDHGQESACGVVLASTKLKSCQAQRDARLVWWPEDDLQKGPYSLFCPVEKLFCKALQN